jgi:hypothetical protein
MIEPFLSMEVLYGLTGFIEMLKKGGAIRGKWRILDGKGGVWSGS